MKIKWVNGRWCVGQSFLSSLFQGHRNIVSEGAKESSDQKSCGCLSISTFEHRNQTHRDRRRAVGWKLASSWLQVSRKLACCQGRVGGGPLEQRAGALWGWWGCVHWAVTHGQYIIVAGDVATVGKVIGALGEASGHSVRSLQDTHCWLCDSWGKKKGKVGEVHEKNIEVEVCQVQTKEKG